MARRRPDPVLQKTRRLARAGRRKEAADILEQALRDNPHNLKAREEFSRYLTGTPFTFEESDYKELQTIISDFLHHPQRFSSMRKSRLRQLRHRVAFLEKALLHMLTVADKKSLQQLHGTIGRALQRHRKPIGRLGIILAAGAVLLAGLGGTGWFLHHQAAKAAETMAALSKKDYEINTALNLLKIYDTGLNRTLNRQVGEEAERLRHSIKVARQRYHEIDSILKEIESRKQSVVGQGVRRRALIERQLRMLGSNAEDLQKRWAELCRLEQKELNQQRLSLAEELMAPLPTWQDLTGIPEDDTALLKARLKVLQQRINIYEDASEALKIPEEIIKPAREQHEANTALLKEVNDYQALLNLLPTARSYTRYRELLQMHPRSSYQPAQMLRKALEQMPVVATVRGMMQEHGQNISHKLLQAAKSSLLDGKPTFSADFPASKEQLHLLEELLSNSALRTRLYELTNVDDRLEAYSEALPKLRNGRACFMRSSLDPQRNFNEPKAVEWQNPQAVVSRTLDPRPLYKALGLDNRSGFAAVVNMPATLTRLLQHAHPDVPPLAKAYIFHHLIQVNNNTSNPVISGLRYAPDMRRIMEEFENIRKECHIQLDGNCWLRRTEAHALAERRFANWFHKHRKADFVAELRRNFGVLLNIEPRFCGYINQNGEPVLFEQVSKGQMIWHMSQSAMVPSPYGQELQKPDLFSPVFLMKKQG
ncbi:MAG: hypothetical protein IKW48_00505 [Akkermansia sp.]|nr:hypothetical protein [Akkermansia sp.]